MAATRGYRPILNLIGAFLGVLIFASAALAASVDIMPVSDIKPGMTGYCLTTLKGFEPERLTFEILGVEGTGPQSYGILFLGTDDKFKRFGILHGMSGSPCYVNGKLIGALSYGGFAEKEPIGGITPIEEMLRVLEAPVTSESKRSSGGFFAAQAAGLEPYLDERGRFRLPLRMDAIKNFGQDSTGIEISGALASGIPLLSQLAGAKLRPIPLSFVSSWAGASDLLGNLGFEGVHSSSPDPVVVSPESLCPGCPLGSVLVTGDMNLSGMGTLTYIDGDTILAYGHSAYNAGSVSYPMCSGIVHTGFPSYFYSYKMTSASQPLGVITQDRSSAIAGKIGAQPDLLPAEVWLANAASDKSRKFHFETIRDRYFTPLLLALVADYCVYTYQHDSGMLTLDWQILIAVKDRAPIELTDSYSNFDYGFG